MIMVSALCAALGAGIGAALVAMFWRGRGNKGMAFSVAAAVGALLGSQYAAPRVHAWWEVRNAESTLLEQRVYRVIKQYEPATYAKLLAEYKIAAQDPGDQAARVAKFARIVTAEVGAVTSRRMATASDDALLPFTREMVANMRTLQPKGDNCFRFLFPQVSGPIDVTEFFDKDEQQRSLDVLASVIESSGAHPLQPPPPTEMQAKLAPILTAMYQEFGADTQMLANPGAPGVDRAKVCAITISLYERILRLPEHDAGLVMRGLTETT
jgi:hypothetical protein